MINGMCNTLIRMICYRLTKIDFNVQQDKAIKTKQ